MDIDVLIDKLKELKNNGIEEVYVNNKYFYKAKEIKNFNYKPNFNCCYLEAYSMTYDEAVNLIEKQKRENNINYTYKI